MVVAGFRASSELERCKRFVHQLKQLYHVIVCVGHVLCLNQCVFGVDMRSNVSAMCFLVRCVCALVFKVL